MTDMSEDSWDGVQPYKWSLCSCGGHSPPLRVQAVWCMSGVWMPPPPCFPSALSGTASEEAGAVGPHREDHHQPRAADDATVAHTLRSAHLRRHILTWRLRSVRSSCRRRSKLVLALAVAHRDALSQYRDLVEVVTRILREKGLSEPDETTEVTTGMLAAITCRARQLAADYAHEQVQLARLTRFGDDLKVKVHRDTKRVWRAKRQLAASRAPAGPLRDFDSTLRFPGEGPGLDRQAAAHSLQPVAPMRGRFCCICGGHASVPFPSCSYCGEKPSYHHGRCCLHKPSPSTPWQVLK